MVYAVTLLKNVVASRRGLSHVLLMLANRKALIPSSAASKVLKSLMRTIWAASIRLRTTGVASSGMVRSYGPGLAGRANAPPLAAA